MIPLKPSAAIVSHQYRINEGRSTRIAEGYAMRVPFGFQVAGLLVVAGLVIVEKREGQP
jgi:hypothetical protein